MVMLLLNIWQQVHTEKHKPYIVFYLKTIWTFTSISSSKLGTKTRYINLFSNAGIRIRRLQYSPFFE